MISDIYLSYISQKLNKLTVCVRVSDLSLVSKKYTVKLNTAFDSFKECCSTPHVLVPCITIY